jgi:hypothetical protein
MAGWITPLKAPLVPKTRLAFHSPKTPDESTSGSPLRRTLTLTNGFPHATKNCPAHSSIRTILGLCCVKNTQPAGPCSLEYVSPKLPILVFDQCIIDHAGCNRE